MNQDQDRDLFNSFQLDLYDEEDQSSASTSGGFSTSPCPNSPFPAMRMTPRAQFIPELSLTPAIRDQTTENSTRQVSFHHSLFSGAPVIRSSQNQITSQDDFSAVFQLDEEQIKD
jgi:hypothetical protein